MRSSLLSIAAVAVVLALCQASNATPIRNIVEPTNDVVEPTRDAVEESSSKSGNSMPLASNEAALSVDNCQKGVCMIYKYPNGIRSIGACSKKTKNGVYLGQKVNDCIERRWHI
ncbi:hypothetical protein THASP1DRAFT_23465 [Thamnocephalis sphaerospora]|uniref:Chitin-binding type-2 domain-containing protein n=1 Tax=Thamnocephalis sphaerospora TaxID=78915 RepID=A0A4V1IWS3_9FUNG|nr:hypothetical protein THASP1DRAFT_23465 [Thamnocephalis sphaerospora]|eukprot:RKP08559.1 hypothetical protein THASP1DRAFT_23465 [Thamnocephalis sphaerospora]